ncbi:MAG: hypothetical protein JXA67_08270 [Micromonosporaceae bacterium]|nr:hypothetical protein [Micromonosporaceae bacterium]
MDAAPQAPTAAASHWATDQEASGQAAPAARPAAAPAPAAMSTAPPASRIQQSPTPIPLYAHGMGGHRPPGRATRPAPRRRPVGPRPRQWPPSPGRGRPMEADLRTDSAETSPWTMQMVLLSLGGLLLAGASIVLTVIAFASISSDAGITLLALITVAALALPIVLARRGLTATAETVAAVALLLVLLDGYVAWSLRLFGAPAVETTTYFGVVCLCTAAISIGYHATSHLVAPRFATLLALQPVIPLIAYPVVNGPSGLALVLAGVAAIDLGFSVGLVRLPAPRTSGQDTPPAPRSRPDGRAGTDTERGAGAGAEPGAATVPATDLVLMDFAWVLFALAYAAGMVCAAFALIPATGFGPALQGSLILVMIAMLGVAGGIIWRRGGVPDLMGGIATVAIVVSAAKIGMVAWPGHTLLLAAGGIALVALGIPLLPGYARRGPMLAGAVTAAGTAVLLLLAAVPAITAPLRAATPLWSADLSRYSDRVAASAGSGSWQLVAAGLLLTAAVAIMLPGSARPDGVVIGATITMLCAPAALGLTWIVTPAIAVAAAVAIIAVGLNVARPRTASVCLTSAIILATYAVAVGMTRPAATALTLTAITIAGTAVACTPRSIRDDPRSERVVTRVTDTAGGGALLAFPGAVAAGTATLLSAPSADRTAIILVATSLALGISIGATALAQLSRREQSRPLLIGTTLATIALIVATCLLPGAGPLDTLVGFLMAVGTALLWLSPSIDARQTFHADFSGADAATAALTVATISAVFRATALLVPGVAMLSIAVLVLVIAVAIQILPEEWRRGPVAGGSLVGVAVALYASVFAVAGTIGVLRASSPFWKADTGSVWLKTAGEHLGYGAQVPLTLLLLAAAAAVALPRRYNDAATGLALALAATSAPVGFGLSWPSPLVIGWIMVTGLALAAALAGTARSGYVRLAVAGGLCFATVTISLARPETTASTLLAFALTGATLATVAAFLGRRRAARAEAPGWEKPGGLLDGGLLGAEPPIEDPDRDAAHLAVVGGIGLAAALVLVPAAVAAMVAAGGQSSTAAATSALAAVAAGLAFSGLVCQRHRAYLPFVSGGVAVGGILAVLLSIPSGLRTITVFAAGAALLGVMAELIRIAEHVAATTGWGQRENALARSGQSEGFGHGVVATAGVPAAIAIVMITPAVVAALLGPYRWITRAWGPFPDPEASLGWFSGWAASGTHVLAAFILMLAGALVAIGLGGDRNVIANRAVSVIIPGVALTLLIAPAAFRTPYPVQPMAALLVATIAGLGVALTPPPGSETAETPPLRAGRQLAVVIAILAAGAGASGSLATRGQTLTALAILVVVGFVGAFRGKTPVARMTGWQVAAGSAILLALTTGLAMELSAARCAYPVLMVSGLLLGFAGLLSRFWETESLDREIAMIESIAYIGAIGAVLLTLRSIPDTAAICFALGAILGLAAARPQRKPSPRTFLVISAAASELIAVWLLLVNADTVVAEAYTLPFALLALVVGLVDLRRRPDTGSATAYGPALVAGFAPTLFIVLTTDAWAVRRVLLIVAAVLTVAIGSWFRQKAPVVIGAIVTAVATVHELILLGRYLPWPVLLALFTAAGILLVVLGATFEKRRQNVRRIKGALNRMR